MSTDDLIAWLNAQLDDDERIARAANPSPWRWRIPDAGHLDQNVIFGDGSPRGMDKLRQVCNMEAAWEREANAEHIIRNDPERVLREVAAKRKLLAWHSAECTTCMNYYSPYCDTTFAIAEIYSDRPGYRDRWRPR